MDENILIPGVHIPDRRQPRLKVDGRIQSRELLKPEEPFAESRLKDISQGGVRMSAASLLSKGTQLVLELSLPGLKRSIRTIAQVVWIRKEWPAKSCECGLQFTQIQGEDRSAITHYVLQGVVARAGAAPA